LSNDPREGKVTQEFIAFSDGEEAEVIWSLDTDMFEGVPIYIQLFSAYMGFFMDTMEGKDYEQGLKNLQELIKR